MMQLIKTILEQFIKDIDSGNSNINEEEQDMPAIKNTITEHKKQSYTKKATCIMQIALAPQVGLEPTTLRLTAACSAN